MKVERRNDITWKELTNTKLRVVAPHQAPRDPEYYAADFIRQLRLDSKVEHKCEWSCLLWSKHHWAEEAKKAKIVLQQTKERQTNPSDETLETVLQNSRFLNSVAQVYTKLFGCKEQFCSFKNFENCPLKDQREDLLRKGALASVFVTILYKAALYSMLDRYPTATGFMNEEYNDVYGINIANFQDLENALVDGRFASMYEAVVNRATQIAGIPPKNKYIPRA